MTLETSLRNSTRTAMWRYRDGDGQLTVLHDAVWKYRPGAFYRKTSPSEVYKPAERIRRLEAALKEHPHLPLSLDDAADILRIHRSYCCRVFRKEFGKPFSAWRREIRIAAAKRFLESTALSITGVGAAVGYRDLTTFERNFRKSAGTSPSEYRKLHESGMTEGKGFRIA